ncbi:MAG: hypothetical protein C0501_16615 [Isosphaera sp.]|nr:hypothetical protein [Isosphaera sp.]
MTRLAGAAAVVAAALAAGCGTLWCGGGAVADRLRGRTAVPIDGPTFSRYLLDGWEWGAVNRVVVLPFLNESAYTRADEEVAAALRSELQKLGRFEVVAAPPDDHAVLAAVVHRGGRFDEAVMLEIARLARADVVVHGTVTQYSPYPRPRLGLVLQAVGPERAKVVSSVDGLWDSTDLAVAERARVYFRQTPERPPWVRNRVIARDDSFAADLALESPALFQRFVCREAALTLLGLPVPLVAEADPGQADGANGTGGKTGKGCAPPAAPPTPATDKPPAR